MQWFNGEEMVVSSALPTSVTPVVTNPVSIKPVQTSGFQAINAPAAGVQGQSRPRDPSPPPSLLFNKHKRPRISESDRPPCLRCKILKKKVSWLGFETGLCLSKSSVTHWITVIIVLHRVMRMKRTSGKCWDAIVKRFVVL